MGSFSLLNPLWVLLVTYVNDGEALAALFTAKLAVQHNYQQFILESDKQLSAFFSYGKENFIYFIYFQSKRFIKQIVSQEIGFFVQIDGKFACMIELRVLSCFLFPTPLGLD
jgi:hypothetical protein